MTIFLPNKKLRISMMRMIEEAKEVDTPLHVTQQPMKDLHKSVPSNIRENKQKMTCIEKSIKFIIGRMDQIQVEETS
jgi:hypothetical protein